MKKDYQILVKLTEEQYSKLNIAYGKYLTKNADQTITRPDFVRLILSEYLK